MNPYLTPFRDALNLAAAATGAQQPSSHHHQAEEEEEEEEDGPTRQDQGQRPGPRRSASTISSTWRRRPDHPYKLVEARNVGMTAILLFARRPDAICHVQAAECAFGIANMGNKGAVALRVTYSDAGAAAERRRTTELTFVATHLAAMEYNLRRRNANWASIVVCSESGCLAIPPPPRATVVACLGTILTELTVLMHVRGPKVDTP